jgi:hypothetical protein
MNPVKSLGMKRLDAVGKSICGNGTGEVAAATMLMPWEPQLPELPVVALRLTDAAPAA